MNSLDDKVVIVTGASSGIGRATAHAFMAAGARVVLVARRADVLAEVQRELTPYAKDTLAIPADLVKDEDLQVVYRAVIEEFGQIDILVNNAGIAIGGELQSQEAATIRKMFDLNMYAPVRLTQLVLPTMLAQKRGHIVNVSSMAGLILAPGQTTYAVTRSAMIAFSHALRREVAGTGIGVSVVLPGWTQTAMLAKMDLGEMRRAGLLTPWTTVDDPAVPAQAIVSAVRNNQDQVRLGGIQFLLGDLFQRLSPLLLDWYYGVFWNKKQAMKVLRDLG